MGVRTLPGVARNLIREATHQECRVRQQVIAFRSVSERELGRPGLPSRAAFSCAWAPLRARPRRTAESPAGALPAVGGALVSIRWNRLEHLVEALIRARLDVDRLSREYPRDAAEGGADLHSAGVDGELADLLVVV